MPQSLANVAVHLVFSTKNRIPLLKDADLRVELWKYLAGALRNLDSPSIIVNGFEDHVHLLFRQSRKKSMAEIVEEIKKTSSAWMKTKGDAYRSFYWQSGYGVFSVSQSNIAAVIEYIQRQEEHHRRLSFQEEYRELLRRHEFEFDERYVWD